MVWHSAPLALFLVPLFSKLASSFGGQSAYMVEDSPAPVEDDGQAVEVGKGNDNDAFATSESEAGEIGHRWRSSDSGFHTGKIIE